MKYVCSWLYYLRPRTLQAALNEIIAARDAEISRLGIEITTIRGSRDDDVARALGDNAKRLLEAAAELEKSKAETASSKGQVRLSGWPADVMLHLCLFDYSKMHFGGAQGGDGVRPRRKCGFRTLCYPTPRCAISYDARIVLLRKIDTPSAVVTRGLISNASSCTVGTCSTSQSLPSRTI